MNVTFENTNTTFSIYEPHLVGLYEDPITKLLAASIHTLIQVCAVFLWFGIAHFERFGGDPCKRSISNQLVSYNCIAILIFIVGINRTILLVRIVYGCLPLFLGEVLAYLRGMNVYLHMILTMLNMGYKCLQLYQTNFTASLNDDFWSVISLVMTVTTSIFISTIEYMLGLYYIPISHLFENGCFGQYKVHFEIVIIM